MKKVTWKQKSIKKCVAWILAFALILPLMPLEVFADTEAETEVETLDPALTEITFSDWGVADNTYAPKKKDWGFTANYFEPIKKQVTNALSGKVMNGNVTFSSAPFQFKIGMGIDQESGNESIWTTDAVCIYRNANTAEDTLLLNVGNTTPITLTQENTGVDLVENEFNLKISYQEVDTNQDGAKDQLKIGVWFNDKLYNNKYFELTNYTLCLSGWMGFWATDVDAFVKVESCEKILNQELTEISFNNFGVADNTYAPNRVDWGFNASYKDVETAFAKALSGKVFNGNVTFGSAAFSFKLGKGTDSVTGGENQWGRDMICIYRDKETAEGSLLLNVGSSTLAATLTKENTGVDLVGKEFNLKVSIREVSSQADGTLDRTEIGIWINNKLWSNKYFYVSGANTYIMTGWVGFYTHDAAATIKAESCEKKLNETLKKITFSDWGIANGNYQASDGNFAFSKNYSSKGTNKKALSGIVMHGKVTFDSGAWALKLGLNSVQDIWAKDMVVLYRNADTAEGTLLLNVGSTNNTITMTQDIAGEKLVGNEIDLKISLEEISSKANGVLDRLEVGIWINDKLYKNQYSYVIGDYTDILWGWMGYSSFGAPIRVESCKEKEGTYITETNTGDMNRVPYNNDEITADLEVGVASYPVVVDKNGDGYMDLMVGGNGQAKVGHGTYIFYGSAESQDKASENYLVMDKGRQIAEHGNTFYGSYLYDAFGNYDKTMLIGAYDPAQGGNTWAVLDAANYPTKFVKLTGRPPVGVAQEILDMGYDGLKFNPWTMFMADYDGDGDLDWITGWGNWEDYSTSGENVSGSKYTSEGLWDGDGDGEEDLVHGWVMWNENLDETQGANGVGAAKFSDTNTKGNLVYVYDYEENNGVKSKIENTKEPLDVYGCTDPQFRDFDKDGDLDIVCCSFIGELIYFENIAKQGETILYNEPTYIKGRSLVKADGSNAELELAMPVMTAFDWNNDGYMDLICGEEDGRVCLVEHTGTYDENGTPIMKDLQFFQTPADSLKDGALNTPYSVDWDGDGDEDIISGNSAGFISFIENLTIKDGVVQGDLENPIWANPVRMENEDGTTYRIMAGKTGSIQGPNEAKWGYTILSVADWDGDGVLDIMSNNITGQVFWHKGIKGQKTVIGNPQPVEVEWTNGNKYPEWNWWAPNGNELVVQWRTTPYMIDLPLDEDRDGVATGDGLMDLVMMDYQGYMSFFQRYRDTDGTLKLKEGQRIFKLSSGADMYFRDYTSAEYGREGKSGKIAYALSDFDCDGDIDILRNGDKNIAFYENISETPGGYEFNATPVDVHERILVDHTPTPAVCDWNGDNVPDLLVGTMDGHFYYMTNSEVASSAIDSVDMNAVITESVAMNYSVKLADGVTETPTMTFAMKNGTTLKAVEGTLIDNVYTFTYPGVKPQDIANTITAKLTVGTVTMEYKYSVLDYCVELLQATELTKGDGTAYTAAQIASLKELVVDLVEYGAAVQLYGELATVESADLLTTQLENKVAGYTDYDMNTDDTLDGLENAITSENKLSAFAGDASYTWTGATLVFRDTINIRGRFEATEEEVNSWTMKVTVDGVESNPCELKDVAVASGTTDTWYVDFNEIYANEFDKPIRITFYNGDEAVGKTLNYSVNTYLNAKANDSNTLLKNLLLGIDGYGDAALAFYSAISQ